MELQTITENHLTTHSSLSIQVKAIGKEILNYNLLTPFPLSDGLIRAYSEKLIELSPDIEPVSVRIAINSLIMGFTPYDKGSGIQNLRNALFDVKAARTRLEQQNERNSDRRYFPNEDVFQKAKEKIVEINERSILFEIDRYNQFVKKNGIY
ncbi:hypothetical protein ABDK00_013195 [Niabella insulamsoli]|uniref:hypothetical protein n=1 Tax=Niabella insulamsoli TaxID=3144874 RepID=UPI0031FDFE25